MHDNVAIDIMHDYILANTHTLASSYVHSLMDVWLFNYNC